MILLQQLFLLPRNTAIALLKGYRLLISPLYGDVCRYAPSCSSYALTAFQLWGMLGGVGLTIWRLLRCNPFTPGGIDDVPTRRKSYWRITPRGYVQPLRPTH